jgi:type 1 glutamine amidotransferase
LEEHMEDHPPAALLILRGLVHPTWLACLRLRRILEATPSLQLQRASSLEVLPRLSMDQVHSLVIYFHHRRLSPSAMESLDAFIRQGGGLLAVHGASASFKTERSYHEILGGRFIGHGSVAEFEVQPVHGQEGVFEGVGSFSVRDELYRHEFDPANQVHFSTPVGTEQEPIVWTRIHGDGRVCYCALGHKAQVFRHPAVIEILQRGLLWVSGFDAHGKVDS